MRYKILLLIMAVLFCGMPGMAGAQNDTIVEKSDDISVGTIPSTMGPLHPLEETGKLTADSLKKWEFHLSMGTAIMGNNFMTASVFGITPSVIYRPNERLKVRMSVSAIDSYSMMPQGNRWLGEEPRSLAPVRNPKSSAGSTEVSVTWKANDRLWLAASVMRIGGQLATGAILNPWMLTDRPVDLNATAVTAAMRYRIGDDNYLDIHMSFIDDRTGALGPMYLGAPFGPMHSFSAHGCFDYYNPLFDTKW